MAFGANNEVRGKEGHLQDGKKSRCSVNRCWPCPTYRSQTVTSDNSSDYGQGP